MESMFHGASGFSGMVGLPFRKRLYAPSSDDSSNSDEDSSDESSSDEDSSDEYKGASAGLSFSADFNLWDTERVTNMRNIFNGAAAFDGDISKWKTERVTTFDPARWI